MDFLRAGGTLLRSSQPLLSFLVPAAHQVPESSRLVLTAKYVGRSKPSATHFQAQRSFSSSVPQQEGDAQPTRNDQAADNDPSGRVPETQQSSSGPSISSAQKILNTLRETTASTVRNRAARISKPGNARADVLNMLSSPNPFSKNPPVTSKLFAAGERTPPAVGPLPGPLPFKLGPEAGRTIMVDNMRGIDVGRAFKQLDSLISRNRIKVDLRMQRFHERPGLKRKRLKSQRWRRRFKQGFKETIEMVQKLRRQGW